MNEILQCNASTSHLNVSDWGVHTTKILSEVDFALLFALLIALPAQYEIRYGSVAKRIQSETFEQGLNQKLITANDSAKEERK